MAEQVSMFVSLVCDLVGGGPVSFYKDCIQLNNAKSMHCRSVLAAQNGGLLGRLTMNLGMAVWAGAASPAYYVTWAC